MSDQYSLPREHARDGRCHTAVDRVTMIFQRLLRKMPLLVVCLLLAVKAVSRATDGNLDLSSLPDGDLNAMTVRLERLGCYGDCPAYTLTIHGDGRVEFNGKSHVAQLGAHESRVDADVIKALAGEFAKAKFLGLPEEYSGQNCSRYCTDMPTVITELSVKEVTHRVKHYYGCGGVPKALFELESGIDKLANTRRWTGDVSKAGPFGTTCVDR